MVKAIKELAPKAAMIAVCVKTSRSTSTTKIVKVARLHCNIYPATLCLNFLSIILIFTPVSLSSNCFCAVAGVLYPLPWAPNLLRQLQPVLAAFAIAFSSVTAVSNNLRLRRMGL